MLIKNDSTWSALIRGVLSSVGLSIFNTPLMSIDNFNFYLCSYALLYSNNITCLKVQQRVKWGQWGSIFKTIFFLYFFITIPDPISEYALNDEVKEHTSEKI